MKFGLSLNQVFKYMLKYGISIIAFFLCGLSQAQIDSSKTSSPRSFNLKIAYNSSLIYPGLSAGIEFPIQHLSKLVIKPRKSFNKEKFISGNLNWYHHPYFHDNLYLTVEWVMGRTRNSGFISEFSAGPGLSRTFLGGTTYRVDDNGNVSLVKLAGYYYALVTVGGGFGYDLSVKRQLPFSAMVKMNLISMFPYNSTVYLRPVMEIGIRYMPWYRKKKLLNGSNLMSKPE